MVTSGTGKRAQVGDDYIWGKTGTTDNNGDAWFVGANEDVTAAVWVGYADGATPMTTEFGGLPVDGGTIPAELWASIISAYDNLKASRDAGGSGSTDTTTDTSSGSTYVAPSTTAAPTETAPVEPATPAPAEPATPAPTPTPDAGGAKRRARRRAAARCRGRRPRSARFSPPAATGSRCPPRNSARAAPQPS